MLLRSDKKDFTELKHTFRKLIKERREFLSRQLYRNEITPDNYQSENSNLKTLETQVNSNLKELGTQIESLISKAERLENENRLSSKLNNSFCWFQAMIETVEDKHELIKNSFEIIWKATDGQITSVTFNKNPPASVTFNLNDGTSETLCLDPPNVILIKSENFAKIVGRDEKIQITIDSDEDYEATQESNITSRETNVESSFEMSTNNNERAVFSLDDNLNELDITPSKSNDQLLQKDSSPSDEYSDTEEEIDELRFASLVSSRTKKIEAVSSDKSNSTRTNSQSKINKNFKITKKNKKNNDKVTDRHVNDALDRVPSDLTNDSLPSINEVLGQSFVAKIVKNINKKANLSQTSNDLELGEEIEHTSESQLNNEHVNTQGAVSSEDASNVDNEKEIENVPGVQKSTTQEVVSSENETTNMVEDDSEEISEIISNAQNQPIVIIDDPIPVNSIIDGVPALYINKGKRKVEPDAKGKKLKKLKPNALDDLEFTKNSESEKSGDSGSEIDISSSHKLSTNIEEVFSKITNNAAESAESSESAIGNQTTRESSNSHDSDFSELDYNISRKKPDTNYKNRTSVYVDRLKKLRNSADNFAAEDPSNLFEMYSQPPEKYFEEVSTKISLNPLPSHIKDVNGCLNYLEIWDQHFNHCEKQEESSKRTTNHWKGNNIKTRMYEKLGNKNKRGILMKWTACWRIHHILWVTNITPSELINVDLNATYFLTATNEEYNSLIKELIGNAEFPEFINPK
ncbi:21228_t:CDS:10, partial [Gigaspora margarita]